MSSCRSDLLKLSTSFFAFSSSFVLFSLPFYKLYCQSTGSGGIFAKQTTLKNKPQKPHHLNNNNKGSAAAAAAKYVTVRFEASKSPQLNWTFRPLQSHVRCRVGESALAFFRATNHSDRPIRGMATYDILPPQAGFYFNKLQCFCFEEQMLKPGESIDMPVLFVVDEEMQNDPELFEVSKITLAYLFFEAKDGFELPLPNFMTNSAAS